MNVINQKITIASVSLDRLVTTELFYPTYFDPTRSYPLLILNDGQDAETLDLITILNDLWKLNLCAPFIIAAPHTNNRMQEYGVVGIHDFKGRGSLAKEYSDFVISELIPFTNKYLKTENFESISISGFSLGGLSAFDIGWRNPNVFSHIAACSGSFWWRIKDLKDDYTDNDRIMHQVVKSTSSKPQLKIMLTCGSLDEKADRNKNGVIDSIDDTLDLITELENKGFRKADDLIFELVIGGKHTQETYGMMLAAFMKWALPRKH